MGKAKSPWQRQWDRNERGDALKELAGLMIVFGLFFLAWGVFHGPLIAEKVDNYDLRGAAKHQAQVWLKAVNDAD